MFVDEQKRKKKLSDDFDVDDIETQKLLSQLVDDDHVEHVNGNDRDDHHHLLDDDDILTSGDEIEDGDNDGRHKHQSTIDTVHVSRTKAITSCLVYSFSSCSMTLVNKSLASSFNHLIIEGEKDNLNILLVVFQAITAVVAVYISSSKYTGWIDSNSTSFSYDIAKQWIPVNIMFCGMLFTGMASLQHNSVPMVTVFKNITNIMINVGEYYFFGSSIEVLVLAAFGIMIGGAVFAARHDVSITLGGLFWMMMNCISTAGYVLYMKYATKTIKLSKFGMIYYNNILCTCFLLPYITFVNGEVSTFVKSKALHTVGYAWRNIFAGMIGFFLNFASLHCVQTTSPSTYAIVGSLSKIPVAILGWYLFSSVITNETWFFICISMGGGFLYSYAKIISTREQEQGRAVVTK